MDQFNRFIVAQQQTYFKALQEIQNGKKLTHWIWYIFPQIEGLGTSDTSYYYAIHDLNEARSYLQNPVLRDHLIEISQALLYLKETNSTKILGHPDDLKVRSCMTLFFYADPSIDVFQKVIDKFYRNEFDPLTVAILERQKKRK